MAPPGGFEPPTYRLHVTQPFLAGMDYLITLLTVSMKVSGALPRSLRGLGVHT